MSTYLIDYENVNKSGLNGVSRLTEKDRVIIFYSAKADKMTFGLHRRLNEAKAVIEYKRVDVGGHNALDFQLATYLGFLVSQNPSEEYCIVSNDRGFEYLTGFWRKPLYSVTLTREIAAGSAFSSQNRAKNTSAEPDRSTEPAETGSSEKTERMESVSSDKTDSADSVPAGKTSQPDSVLSLKTNCPESVPLEKTDAVGFVSSGKTDRPASVLSEKTERLESVSSDKTDSVNVVPSNKTNHPDSVSSEKAERPKSVSSFKNIKEGSQAASEEKKKPANSKGVSGNSVKAGSGKPDSVSDENSSFRTEKRKPAAKPEEDRSRIRRNASGKETPAAAGRKAVSVMAEVEQKEHPAQKTTAGTGRSKAKLGLNHALIRLFGAHKSSEVRKPAKPVVQGEKEKEESKTRKAAENPKTSKNPVVSGNSRTSKAADSRHVVRKNLPEEVNRLTSNLELSEEDRREIASYIQNCRTKQSINNELVRRFRSEKAGEVYKAVKPLIQDKKGKEEPRKTSKAAGTPKTSTNVRTSSPLSEAGKNLSEEVSRLTSNLQLSEEDRRQITSYVQNYKTKQGVNNALVRRFRSQKAGEIYKLIKPLLKEKKGRSHSNSHKR